MGVFANWTQPCSHTQITPQNTFHGCNCILKISVLQVSSHISRHVGSVTFSKRSGVLAGWVEAFLECRGQKSIPKALVNCSRRDPIALVSLRRQNGREF